MKFPFNSLGKCSSVFPATALIALLVFPPSGNINTEQSWREAERLRYMHVCRNLHITDHSQGKTSLSPDSPALSMPGRRQTPDEDDWSSLITVCRRAVPSPLQNAKAKRNQVRPSTLENVSKPQNFSSDSFDCLSFVTLQGSLS